MPIPTLDLRLSEFAPDRDQAMRRSRDEAFRASYELSKACAREVNEARVAARVEAVKRGEVLRRVSWVTAGAGRSPYQHATQYMHPSYMHPHSASYGGV